MRLLSDARAGHYAASGAAAGARGGRTSPAGAVWRFIGACLGGGTASRPGASGANILADGLARKSATAFAIQIVAIGLALLAQMLLARVLGVVQYGIYAYVFAWISLLSLLATLGFEHGMLRFASVYQARHMSGRLRRLIGYTQKQVLAAGGLISIVGLSILIVFRQWLSPDLAWTFAIGVIAVPVIALLRVRSSLLRAFGAVASALIPNMCLREIAIIALVLVIPIGLGFSLVASQAMAAWLVAAIFGLAFVAYRTAKAGAGSAQPDDNPAVDTDLNPTREWLVPALTLLLISGTHLLLKRTDVMVIGAQTGTTEAGVYAVAMYAAGLVILPFTAINAVFGPVIASLHARKERHELLQTAHSVARWALLAGLAIGAPLLLLAPTVLSLIGQEFAQGAAALRILVIGHLVATAFGPVELLVTMTGDERRGAVLYGIMVCANVPLNILLIHLMGIEGAALATATVVITLKLLLASSVRRHLGIRLSPMAVFADLDFSRRRPSGAAPADRRGT